MIDVVLPCLDEVEALPFVLGGMPAGFRPIVVDNGSSDGSGEVARSLGAMVVAEPRRGFGAACHAGLLAATGDIVCFMDCDGSLDPAQLTRVTSPIQEGIADLVLGRRRPIARRAWPLHARLANTLVAHRIRARTRTSLHDLGPMRAAHRTRLLALGLGDRRSGYPLEMVLSAAAAEMRISETNVDYFPRTGRSKVTSTVRGTRQAIHDMRAILKNGPPTLIVIAKAPRPGRVKTRLIPPCTPEQAAAVARAALTDTLAALSAIPAGRRLLVLDGPGGSWIPNTWDITHQPPGGLDVRLAAAFAHADPSRPALLVGMDTPQLDAQTIAEALSPATRAHAAAWYGPAADGGFWALGLARPTAMLARELLIGLPMSSPHTGAGLLHRLSVAGLRVHHLPTLTDIDDAATAATVAALAPHTHFAAAWRNTRKMRH